MTANITQHVIPRGRFTQKRRFTSQGSFGKRYSERGSADPATVTIAAGALALFVVGMLGFFYLRQVVDTASQGGDIQALERQLAELRDHQRKLELEGAQLRSLQTVENRVQRLNLVEADRVSYLAREDGRLAHNAR
jgi:hypothetical protein